MVENIVYTEIFEECDFQILAFECSLCPQAIYLNALNILLSNEEQQRSKKIDKISIVVVHMKKFKTKYTNYSQTYICFRLPYKTFVENKLRSKISTKLFYRLAFTRYKNFAKY